MSAVPNKVIGIAGGSCSGTTTLSKNLEQLLGDELTIFPFDDMFVGLPALEGVRVEDWESPDLYRWGDLFSALRELKLGHAVTVAANSRESTEAGITTRTLVPHRVVVVAGFLALHDDLVRTTYDDTIYLHIPIPEMARRRKARANPDSPWDTEEYINNGLIPGHRRYVMPQLNLANHILDATTTEENIVNRVVDIIDNQGSNQAP